MVASGYLATMTIAYAVPHDLTREPWWAAVRGMKLDSVFDRLYPIDDDAVAVLYNDAIRAFLLPRSVSRAKIRATMERETLDS